MDYFEKKQWIRIAVCLVLVAAITLAMTGVFSHLVICTMEDRMVPPRPPMSPDRKAISSLITSTSRSFRSTTAW